MKKDEVCPDHVTHENLWNKIAESEGQFEKGLMHLEDRMMKIIAAMCSVGVLLGGGALTWGIGERNSQLDYNNASSEHRAQLLMQQSVILTKLEHISQQLTDESSRTRETIQHHMDDPDAHAAMQRAHK